MSELRGCALQRRRWNGTRDLCWDVRTTAVVTFGFRVGEELFGLWRYITNAGYSTTLISWPFICSSNQLLIL
jgi:hypothetical protein